MGATPVATGGGGGGGGSGTVTSVALSAPAEFGVTGSPITTAGTLVLAWQSVAANRVMASPDGASGTPAFRVLVAADVPTLDAAKIGSGTFAAARIPWATATDIGGTSRPAIYAGAINMTGSITHNTSLLSIGAASGYQVQLYSGATLVADVSTTAATFPEPLTVSVSSSDTNTVRTLATLSHATSGVAAAGFGAGLDFRLSDAGGTLQSAGGLNFVLTGATAGSVSSIVTIRIASAGTLYSALLMRYSSGSTTVETSGTCVIAPAGFQVAKFVTSQIEHLKPLRAYIQHSALNTVVESELMNVTGSGTKRAGYGVSKQFQLKCEATENTSAARNVVLWADGTYATRQADVVWYANDYGAEREVLRLRANGTAAAIGFLGATPVARAAHIADPSGGATTDSEARTAINAILVVLENLGLVATS